MSQQIFNPGAGTAVADPPAELEGVSEAASASRSRMFIIGGIVLALILAAGAYFLFFSGGSNDAVPNGPVAVPTHATLPKTGTATKPKAASTTAAVPVATATPSSRDPFVALVNKPAPSSATSTAPTASTAPSAGATSTAPAGSSVPTGGTPKSLMVTAVNHATNTVTSNVDGKPFSAALGQTFDTYFQVIGIQGGSPCAVLRYGDVTLNACQGINYTLSG